MPAIHTALNDWRQPGDPDGDYKKTPVTVNTEDTSITVTTEDGRKVMIEMEGENLRVHAYHPDHDEPFNVDISEAGEIRGYPNDQTPDTPAP